jgi:NTP pyrophosphatase (non-canonical NTP hydrolase)
MDFDGILKFIDEESERLAKSFNLESDKQTLARTVKLCEEVGELCNEVLGALSLLRKDKQDKHRREELEEELADVIITTLLLAKSLGVEVTKPLEKKMAKIKARRDY